jgi:nucleoside-diphosphate-sugar epimerase
MRAPAGMPVYVERFNPPYYRISVNGLCRVTHGMPPLYLNAVRDTTSADDLLDFLADAIGDRYLVRGDVLIMDNNATHHQKEYLSEMRELLGCHGIRLLFLPRYCPELNPIELAWSKIKYRIRKYGKRTLEHALQSLQRAANDVTANNMEGYVRHCGY